MTINDVTHFDIVTPFSTKALTQSSQNPGFPFCTDVMPLMDDAKALAMLDFLHILYFMMVLFTLEERIILRDKQGIKLMQKVDFSLRPLRIV